MTNDPIEQRRPVFSDQDIVRLVEAIKSSRSIHDDCKFYDISHEDMYETVRLAKRVNKVFDESGGVVRKFILTTVLTVIGFIITKGFLKYFKEIVK